MIQRGPKARRAVRILASMRDVASTRREFHGDTYNEDNADAFLAAFDDFVHIIRGALADQGRLRDRNRSDKS